jgi:hypothetical protein
MAPPSPETFDRVFAKLDPAAFSRAFGRWMAAACEATALGAIAVDGNAPEGIPAVRADAAAVLVNREREPGGQRTCTTLHDQTGDAGTSAEMVPVQFIPAPS